MGELGDVAGRTAQFAVPARVGFRQNRAAQVALVAFNLIGICPYIGVVTSLVYRNVVARHLPARPDRSHPVNVRPQNPGPSFFEALSETGEPTRQRSPDPVPFNYQPRKQERVRIPHADCHATGWRENPTVRLSRAPATTATPGPLELLRGTSTIEGTTGPYG